MTHRLLSMIVGGLLALPALAIPGIALAQSGASVLIWPVNPVIEADMRAGALWLENKGRNAVTVQVRVFAWAQQDGRDAYAEQDEILGTPPIITIQPGDKQLVRLTRTTPPPVEAERPYRLVIDEVPTSDGASASGAAVSFRMRYSLPLFSYAANQAEPGKPAPRPVPQMAWRIGSDGGKRFLEISNTGAGHARLTDVALANGRERWTVAEGLFGYVLPASSMRWDLPDSIGDATELTATVNGEEALRIERQPG
ncbi:fimbria/pilus periplasmic chaperone [Altererythrobacter xixiisoli]|uniref:Fimbria/pilus periplasmic chaperone n=1 Tax=Croceibacterium xixiisoli TaxID=1476466 RepID=A0A6I4TSE5_9SPHN|nr:molecular chaperone [Croceibacterium xixiisoli]MXO97518.1 fimbria/pilus periplasmic chaperone [Croceibacterium xixiisoli]